MYHAWKLMYYIHSKCQILQPQVFKTNEENIFVHLTLPQIWHAWTNWTVETSLLLIVQNKTFADPKLDCRLSYWARMQGIQKNKQILRILLFVCQKIFQIWLEVQRKIQDLHQSSLENLPACPRAGPPPWQKNSMLLTSACCNNENGGKKTKCWACEWRYKVHQELKR